MSEAHDRGAENAAVSDLPPESRSDEAPQAPVSGSCAACGCALGYAASLKDNVWHCCGPCAGSGRCICGCVPERRRALVTDAFVPTRRMFAARRPDELRGAITRQRNRAFPFADPRRGR